ncbi:MAG: hypothetical protein HY812_10775 [Planctomycetes bacterium]|nr:hypothetical protein [Planctomycetota bacterium]
MMLRVTALLALLACAGCQLPREPFFTRPAPDPNESVVRAGQAQAAPAQEDASSVQQTARTTLLEDNEHLRDLLTKALAERRDLEGRLAAANELAAGLQSQVQAQEDAIAALSEQQNALRQTVEELTRERERLEGERKTLAEMFAVEKRQRLAFEKELLEREIAARTVSRGGG